MKYSGLSYYYYGLLLYCLTGRMFWEYVMTVLVFCYFPLYLSLPILGFWASWQLVASPLLQLEMKKEQKKLDDYLGADAKE